MVVCLPSIFLIIGDRKTIERVVPIINCTIYFGRMHGRIHTAPL